MSVAVAAFAALNFLASDTAAQASGDGKIYFANASFEDVPGESRVPAGWQSAAAGSTPDIFPGAWNMTNIAPQHGKTCIGLVTRDDGTSEEISQLLHATLEAGVCYTFSVQLSHAEKYVGYNLPARVRVWGGSRPGEKSVLLGSSELVKNSGWQVFKCQFVPTKPVRCITFQAYFGSGVMFFYKGNVLLDACSPIERCDRA